MSQQVVSLNLPDELYNRIHQVAEDRDRPVEDVMVESLALIFGGEETLPEPADLPAYSDEQLWALVYSWLAWPEESRRRELVALGKRGALTGPEQAELDSLVALLDRRTLIRSHALALLKQRGHDIDSLIYDTE